MATSRASSSSPAPSSSPSDGPPALYFCLEQLISGAAARYFPVIEVVRRSARDRYSQGQLLDGRGDVDFGQFVTLVTDLSGGSRPVDGVHCYPRQNPGLEQYHAITSLDTLAYIINEANHFEALSSEVITISTISPTIEYDPPEGSDPNMVLTCADLRGNGIDIIGDFTVYVEPSDSDSDDNNDGLNFTDLEIRAAGRVVIFRKFGDMEDDYYFYIHRGDRRQLAFADPDPSVEGFYDLVLECGRGQLSVLNYMTALDAVPQRVSPGMFRDYPAGLAPYASRFLRRPR